MAMADAARQLSSIHFFGPQIMYTILTFSNGCILLTIEFINTKLGIFVSRCAFSDYVDK